MVNLVSYATVYTIRNFNIFFTHITVLNKCKKHIYFDPLKFDLVEHLLEKDIADIVVADKVRELPVQDVVEGEAGKHQAEGLTHTKNISDNHKDEQSTNKKIVNIVIFNNF